MAMPAKEMKSATVSRMAPQMPPHSIPIPPLAPPAPGPGNYPDGTILKSSGPEIDMMQGHERRWVPDPVTFSYMGLNWNAVLTISASDWNSIPVGPPFPSRADGTLLKASAPNVYMMQNGQRHWIPDPATLYALGYNWGAVQSVTDNDLNAIPLGAPVPEGGKVVVPQFPIISSRDDNFPGSGGFMHTDATIFSSGLLNVVTHTWEVTDLRGFVGAVAVTVLDQNQDVLWVSGTKRFGVDGRWIGTSDRTDNWIDNLPAAVLPDIRFIGISQHWNQNNVFDDIEAWLAGLANAAPYISTIATTVVTIASLF